MAVVGRRKRHRGSSTTVHRVDFYRIQLTTHTLCVYIYEFDVKVVGEWIEVD